MIATSLVSIFFFIGISVATDLRNDSPNCGDELTASDGTIVSPGRYPGNATPDHCEWIIRGVPNRRIRLDFLTMEMMRSERCERGFVEIREIKGDTNILLARFCRPEIPPVLVSSPGASVKIIYNTDGSASHGLGFRISYHSLGNICGSFTADRGTISAPNVTVDHGHEECEWIVQSQPGKSTRFQIDILSTNESPVCEEDYYKFKIQSVGEDPLYIHACNRQKTWVLTSSKPSTTITFLPHGNHTYAGFRMSYSTVENSPQQRVLRDDEAKRFILDY